VGTTTATRQTHTGICSKESASTYTISLDSGNCWRRTGRIRPGPRYEFLKSEWSNVDCVKAGHWLTQCALSLAFSPDRFFFPFDETGFPTLAPQWEADMESIRDELFWRNPVLIPHTTPPPDWTRWRKQYTSRLQATFARDWRPETKGEI